MQHIYSFIHFIPFLISPIATKHLRITTPITKAFNEHHSGNENLSTSIISVPKTFKDIIKTSIKISNFNKNNNSRGQFQRSTPEVNSRGQLQRSTPEVNSRGQLQRSRGQLQRSTPEVNSRLQRSTPEVIFCANWEPSAVLARTGSHYIVTGSNNIWLNNSAGDKTGFSMHQSLFDGDQTWWG